MLPIQTLHILVGIAVALLYGGAVLSVGILLIMAVVPQPMRTAMRTQAGLPSLVWLGFVLGQGGMGVSWLVLSLTGLLYAWFVWGFCAIGWGLGCAMLWAWRRECAEVIHQMWSGLRAGFQSYAGYLWIALGVLVGLQGLAILVPPSVADALWVYLPSAKVIAFSHTLALQPFNSPHNGLYPLQVDLHWAALFSITNETAVQVWDYVCALSFLSGVGLLAWSLTSNHRVALIAILMMFSTPGFYALMGGTKVDNAAAQYGVAACLWLLFLPPLGRRAVICAGLCAGWAVASRYTNIIFLPASLVFFTMIMARAQGHSWSLQALRKPQRVWVSHLLVGALAAGVAVAPMLIKNWLLVGCPLTPHIGCQDTYWAGIYGASRQNITVVDLLFYPLVWTFASRADMLGNISPLFIGFLPFFLLTYPASPLVRATSPAGIAGLVSLATWLLIEPLILFTRWLLIPLALCTIPLSAALVSLEHELRSTRVARWLVKSAIGVVLLFLLFQSRAVVHAVRYIAAIDTRDTRYASEPYYDVATWLNTHRQPGQRVALYEYEGYYYFLNADILLSSESAEELQWLWDRRAHLAITEALDFYAKRGFTYVVLGTDEMRDILSFRLHEGELHIVFVGQKKMIGRIEGAVTSAVVGPG
jgi:hypothetical protein